MKMDPAAVWKNVQEQISQLKREMASVIVGQDQIVELMLVALLCRGHCLIVGVPGLAKTLLVSTLGHILGLSFRRIQFTPDLMPMDILGSEILQDGADADNPAGGHSGKADEADILRVGGGAHGPEKTCQGAVKTLGSDPPADGVGVRIVQA